MKTTHTQSVLREGYTFRELSPHVETFMEIFSLFVHIKRRFWKMKILMKCDRVCVVDNGRFELPSSLPSTRCSSLSSTAPCIEFERKTKYFFKHCRNANAVYGLLIFSAKISNANFSFLASLSNARCCCWEEKTPFSREIIFHPRFLFLPRLYQDFHALACVGHSVVPLCMLLRCVGWHMAQVEWEIARE